MLNENDRAYLAGFIDGEGCFSSSKNGGGYYPRFTLVQKDPTYLRELLNTLGYGRVKLRPKTGVWVFDVKGESQLKRFILLVLPFLKMKKAQAQLVLDMYEIPARRREHMAFQLSTLKEVER